MYIKRPKVKLDDLWIATERKDANLRKPSVRTVAEVIARYSFRVNGKRTNRVVYV